MGSPIGKSPIADPIAIEGERLKTIGATAHKLGTRNIRLFSFYPEADVDADAMRLSADRLATLADIARENDLQLLLENEKGVVGDLPERCLQLMRAIDSPHLRFIWDPANFVQCGAVDQVDRWWNDLHPYIGYIHIKDAKLADNSVTVAGDGDGQLLELLTRPESKRICGPALIGAASARSAAFQRVQWRRWHGGGGPRAAGADGGGGD